MVHAQKIAVIAVLSFAATSVGVPREAHAFGSLGKIFHWGRKKQPAKTTPPPPPALTCSQAPSNSFQACYFADPNLTNLKFTQIESQVNHDWVDGSPNALIPVDGFSARYTGTFAFEDADYKFSVTADDGVRLWVDGELLIDQWSDHPPQAFSSTHHMFAGDHVVKLEYYEGGGGATITLDWNKLTVVKRTGVVHAVGRNWVDDQGGFYPLGATMMWSLWGWKFDRERLKQNLQFLKSHNWDYVRILGEVDWPNQRIDPNWPDYSENLAGFLDYLYNECGMRAEITVIGGGGGVDTMALVQKIAAVTNAGRQHMVMNFEMVNEGYSKPVSYEQMKAMGRYLRQNTPNLVALTDAGYIGSIVQNPAWPGDYENYMIGNREFANLGTTHMDRTQGDDGWREVKQPWDYKDLSFPVSHNEPIGPRSSVAEEVDPLRLATLRANGIINGVGAFVLHNGAGVFGQTDPVHNRPPNLWEVPGIDAIMDAVRGVDRYMPPGAGDGRHWNNGWSGSPWNTDAFWAEGYDHGVERNYVASTPDGWIAADFGIKNYAVFTASQHSVIEVFDVIQGKVAEVELSAGQIFSTGPISRDNFGDGAFIIIGHYR